MNYNSNISLTKDGNRNRKIPSLNNNYNSAKLDRIKSMKNLKLKHMHKRNNIIIEQKTKLINLLTNDSLNHLQRMVNNDKLMPFEEYNKIIDKNMLDYKTLETDEKKIIKKNIKDDELYDFEQRNTPKKIEEVKNREIPKSKHKLSRNYSEPQYKITIKDYNYYKNPNDSLNAINNNNEIFNEINKDCLARQRILCINNIKNFASFSLL